VFDDDNNPATEPEIYDTMLGVINDSPRYFSHSGTRRADLRFGQGPTGEIYLMNKRNNTIYLVTNTLVGEDVVVTPPTASAPNFPGNLRQQVYEATTAEIFWDRATDDVVVQGYEVIRNGESLGVLDVLSLFQTRLDPAVTYTYEITAIDNEGNRSATRTIVVSTDGRNKPSTPENLRFLLYSSTAAEIFWDRATDNGIVRGYEIVRNGQSLGERDSLSLFEEGLDPSIVYTYQVTSIDNEGNRSAAASVTLRTADRPRPPGNVRHELYSDTTAEIFWDRATDNNGAVQGYEIVRNGESLGVRDVLSLVERGLDPAKTYTYEVTSIDNDGNRSATATTTLSTADHVPDFEDEVDTVPSITGLRADVYSATTAELFWEWPTFNFVWFEVQRDGVFQTLTRDISYFDDSLHGDTSYYYEIVIIDNQGNRSEPASVSVTTPPYSG
jgi:hypothetical protein